MILEKTKTSGPVQIQDITNEIKESGQVQIHKECKSNEAPIITTPMSHEELVLLSFIYCLLHIVNI